MNHPDWEELIGPRSPLIDQAPELRAALMSSGPYEAGMVLREIGARMSAGSQRMLEATALYFNHIAAIAAQDPDRIDSTLARAESFRDIMGHSRRLASLLWGIAGRSLPQAQYHEAYDLTGFLRPSDADEVLGRLRPTARPTLRSWLRRFLEKRAQLRTVKDGKPEVPSGRLPRLVGRRGQSDEPGENDPVDPKVMTARPVEG